MKILNLGAGGFIGAHLTKRLLDQGHQVVAVDTHSDKITEFLGHPGLQYLEQDIRDSNFDLDGLTQDCDLVIDLIAHANPSTYVKIPLQVFYLNFMENLKIAEACVRQGKRLIQFSSCEVYGKTAAGLVGGMDAVDADPRWAVFSEDESDFILGPVSKQRWIYACAKQLLERVLHAHGLAGSLNYTIIRPFNFIGPKIDYLPGDTLGSPRVFSHFMEALINGSCMYLVEGGRHQRCYTYIDDAIDGIYRIVENPGLVCDRQIFNVGSPYNEVTIRDLAILMGEIYREINPGDNRPQAGLVEVSGEDFYGEGYEDSDRRIPDIDKARRLLGWEPRYGLREALELTMTYYLGQYASDVKLWRECYQASVTST